jgi:thioesterase domain-containing protein
MHAVGDLAATLDAIGVTYPHAPLYLTGYSMGGVVIGMYLGLMQVGGWVGMNRCGVRREWCIRQERERKTLQHVTV